MHALIERALIPTLFMVRAHRVVGSLHSTGAAIVMYHGFTDRHTHEGMANHERKHLHTEVFEAQLAALSAHYHVVPLADVVRAVRDGTPLPPRAVAITIDDGYRSVHTIAFPILRRLGVPATLFLVTEFVDERRWLWTDRVEHVVNNTRCKALDLTIGTSRVTCDFQSRESRVMADRTLRSAVKRLAQEERDATVNTIEQMAGCALGDGVGDTTLYDSLRWEEVSTMVQSGLIEIGSHTHTHVILARCQPDRVARELQHSKDIIERRLLRPCTAFCYPNGRTGDFNAETRSLIRAHGYTCAVTTVYGRNGRGADVFALKRYNFGKPMVWGEPEVRIAGTLG